MTKYKCFKCCKNNDLKPCTVFIDWGTMEDKTLCVANGARKEAKFIWCG